MIFDNKTIFNALAEQYDAYRPHYPPEALLFLVTLGELDRTSDVADIGTGTGRLAIELAKYVRLVYAIDTASVMLQQLQNSAEAEGLTNIRTIEAPGEATGLANESLDMATLAQSFHWMDKSSSLLEASRILKPTRPLVLLWNQVTNTQETYYTDIVSLIKKNNPNYKGGADIISADFPDRINDSRLFGPVERYTFPFEAHYSPENYIGFLLSKSYIGMGISSSDIPQFIEDTTVVLDKSFPDRKVVEKYETVMLVARRA